MSAVSDGGRHRKRTGQNQGPVGFPGRVALWAVTLGVAPALAPHQAVSTGRLVLTAGVTGEGGSSQLSDAPRPLRGWPLGTPRGGACLQEQLGAR